ncbi:ATP-binding cassette domain-containing protein [Actinomadura sp. 9N215]|uniref:ATP-binding cassette domain-containing protein n=1 Tax=Actinomadura sp. 9N215 TaxID=3375150 RepID=UPI0037A00AE6
MLRDVTLSLPPGGVIEVTGRNGAGKSTLLRVIAGLRSPRKGTLKERPSRVGYAPERFPVDQPFTVRSYLGHMAAIRRVSTDSVGTWAERLGFEHLLNVRLPELSKGSAQKVGLAQAFMDTPGLLILDEPFAGLDAATRAALPALLSEFAAEGAIVVVSDHQRCIETLPGVDRLRVANGTVTPHPSRTTDETTTHYPSKTTTGPTTHHPSEPTERTVTPHPPETTHGTANPHPSETTDSTATHHPAKTTNLTVTPHPSETTDQTATLLPPETTHGTANPHPPGTTDMTVTPHPPETTDGTATHLPPGTTHGVTTHLPPGTIDGVATGLPSEATGWVVLEVEVPEDEADTVETKLRADGYRVRRPKR